MRRYGSAFLLGAVALASPAQVAVSIDIGTKYQTIEGFGYEPNFSPWKERSGAFMVEVDLDTTGVYISRTAGGVRRIVGMRCTARAATGCNMVPAEDN